jgi:hypothetical protein
MIILFCNTDSMSQGLSRRYKPEKISEKKFQELIMLNNGKKSIVFSTPDLDAYELNDGRLILRQTFDSAAVVYESVELYAEMMNQLQSPGHILNDYQEEILKIPQNVSQVVSGFFEKIVIAHQGEQLSEVSIQEIEHKVNELIAANRGDEIFFELMMFIGEYVRQGQQGEWVIVPSQESEGTYEVFIRDKNRKMFNIWLPLAKRMNKGQRLHLAVLIENIVSQPSFNIQRGQTQKEKNEE